MYTKRGKGQTGWGGLHMSDILGRGIYSISEAARYTVISHQTLYSWFRDPVRNVFVSDYTEKADIKAISFYDLIDCLVVADLRRFVTMQHIRKAKEILSRLLKTPHPFCRKSFFIDVSERRILDSVGVYEEDKVLVDVITGQGQIKKVIEPHLREIDYSDTTKLARLWKIHTGIEIDPEVRFGKPVIAGTNLTTKIIAMQYYAYDEDAGAVSGMHRIRKRDVLNAVHFELLKGTVKKAA